MKSGKLGNTILYIDDEQANLDGFNFIFRKTYDIFLANNVDEAFEIIDKQKIKVVISDNRMPDMLGTDFFKALSVSHPDIIRILVTAYADTEAVMQAINMGRVYRFITKPWNKNELQVTIDNAIETYDLKQQNQELVNYLTINNKKLEVLNSRLHIEIDERIKAEKDLAAHRDNLELIVKQRTEEIKNINNQLSIANNELLTVNKKLNDSNSELEITNKKLSHEIQARKQAQELLMESENKFRGLIEQSSEGIMIIDINGLIVECNMAMNHIFDLDYNQIVNNYIWDFDYRFVPTENKQTEILGSLKNSILDYISNFDSRISFTTEDYRETPLGNLKYINTVTFPIITPKGKFIGRIFRDFTQKKITEESLNRYKEELENIITERTAQLHESEQHLRTISDNLPGGAIYRGFIDKNNKDKLVYASANITNLSGISYDKLLENFSLFFSKVHPLDVQKLLEAKQKCQRSLEVLDTEIRYIRKNNDILWLQLRIVYNTDKEGKIWWDGYIIDITKKKITEKAAEERDSIIKNIQEGIAAKTGEKLFETIVIKLSETLNASYTYIGEISGKSKEKVHTITLCANGRIDENFEYDIVNTPCADVFNKKVCSFSNDVRSLFPKHKLLKKLKIEGYIGVALFNSHDEQIGIMVSLFTQPIENISFAEQILKIFSSRVGAEMERIKTEVSLKEREEKFRTLFELSPNLKLISMPDGTIIEPNSAFIQLSGFDRNEIIGNTLLNLGMWTSDCRNQVFNEISRNGHLNNFEISLKSKSGKIHYALLSIESIIINNEKTLLSTITDITDRKNAEEAIRQYSDIVHNMQVALCVFHLPETDNNQSITLVKINPSAEKILKIKADDIIGKRIFDIYPFLKEYKIDITLTDVLRTGHSQEIEEFRYYNDTGEILFFTAKIFKMPSNHVCLLFEDITKRKRIEKAVKENEARYRVLFDKSPDGIHLVGTNGEFAGRVMSVNSKVEQMLGYTTDELIGMSTEQIMRDFPVNEKIEWTERLMAGETITTETNFYRKDDSSFPIEVTSSVISLGDELLILSIDRDISERKQSELIIKESEQKLLSIFNSSTDGIIIINLEFTVIEANQTLMNMIGYGNRELLNNRLIDIILPGYRKIFSERLEKTENYKEVSYIELELYHKNGIIIPVDVNSKEINYGGKKAILIIVHDITERKLMEKKLFETIINTEEKERERFAGNLHDEVGPLLSSLKMYISLLAETENKEKKDYIIPQVQNLVKEAITTVREISNDLSPHVLNSYGCVAAIESFMVLKRDFLNIFFNQNLENKRYNLSVEIVLYRIVKELINNTIKHAKASNIEIKLLEEDDNIKLLYSDNGIGFDIESKTGAPAGSIGLLNIMSRIKTINGKYNLSSTKGSGFVFELAIPLK